MDKYSFLEKRIERLENKLFINEAKQVGTLYHVCTLRAYLKYILPGDQLVASGKYYNNIYGGDEYVSFTRDSRFILDSRSDDTVLIQLVVDGDKLSEHYKIGPYNDFAFDEEGNLKPFDDFRKREMEEAVKGPIKNLSKYLKEVRFDIAASHDLTEEPDLKLLKRKRKELQDLVYYKFLGRRSASLGVSNGASLNEVLAAINVWELEEKKQELLFSYELPTIRKAIAAGADVNKKHDADGYPIIYYSEDDGSLPIIKTLLKAGANPNTIQDDGLPVLSYAIANWCENIAKALLKAGANVNLTDRNGITPLMYAVDSSNDSLVKLLIKLGADVNAVDKDNHNVRSYASDDDIINILENAGAAE